MLLLALLGVVLATGIWYLSKKSTNGVTPMISTTPSRPTSMPWWADPYYFDSDFTDIYYYPEGQTPPMLTKTQGILPYNEYYGCPPNYRAQQLYTQGGGPEHIGTPGMLTPLTYCQLVSNPKENLYEDPFGGNSSAFRDFGIYHTIMTNYLVGADNTITPSTVFENRFNIRPVVGGDIQYGGTGRLPDPVLYPTWIG